MVKLIKLEGTDIKMEITSCAGFCNGKDQGCPFFHDGDDFEYDATCQLTNTSGDNLFDAYWRSRPEILGDCPLPERGDR